MTHFCIIGTWRKRRWREFRALWQLIIQGCQIPRWDVRLPWKLHLLKCSFVTDTQGNSGEWQKQLANDIFAWLFFIIYGFFLATVRLYLCAHSFQYQWELGEIHFFQFIFRATSWGLVLLWFLERCTHGSLNVREAKLWRLGVWSTLSME